jgi:hypothetical protein
MARDICLPVDCSSPVVSLGLLIMLIRARPNEGKQPIRLPAGARVR